MTTTTDIEFNLEEIHDSKVAEYFREALTCYRHGAYRACIGMIHNTIFADLLEKVRHLAPINPHARAVIYKIDALQPYEAYEAKLETEMRSEKLLEPEQCRFLNDLRNKRNDAAHPSGHVVTKEHVQYLLSDAVAFFLKERAVYPRQAVTDLEHKLQGEAFLPVNGSHDHHCQVVSEEMKLFNAKTYAALFSMLARCLASSEAMVRRNSRKFVEVVAAFKDVAVRSHLVKGLYTRKLSAISKLDDDYSKAMLWSFIWDPEIGNHLTVGELLQFDQSLAAHCKDSMVSNEEFMAPDFLLENLLDCAPHLLGERLPRTTGFLAANLLNSKRSLALLKLSLVTRDFMLLSYSGIAEGTDELKKRSLNAFLARNEKYLAEEHDPETILRLLRSIRLDVFPSSSIARPHELNLLRSRVEAHYGVPWELVPRDVGRRSHVPQGSKQQMKLDTFHQPPLVPRSAINKELEWDWTR
ncbi:hypothetical protein CO663_18355 [Rhizobium anhuiense]|uniref:hypothetical protein n=1 Tax=Rhizobium anhuiense TaxID=1184720 RepID=UPI000BEAA8DD|nr:hypothetical protein [Rhizobium anhuiense]PDS57281.1 hypothetical protein CO663_18355 [Rhizobium anhuiense]